jgi:hypothetical protein
MTYFYHLAHRARAPFATRDALTRLGLTTNLRLCLDAGDAASYPGSGQSWLDRSGGGYDFFLGTTSGADATDPVFNGTAGRKSSNEYWTPSGGDLFTYDSANESWMTALHQAGAQFTIAMWVYDPVPVTILNDAEMIRTATSSTAGTGVALSISSSFLKPVLNVVNAGADVETILWGGLPESGKWNYIAISVDIVAGTYVTGWAAGNPKSGGSGYAAESGSASYSSPSGGAASVTMRLDFTDSQMRYRDLMIWSRALTSENLRSIWNATRLKYNI